MGARAEPGAYTSQEPQLRAAITCSRTGSADSPWAGCDPPGGPSDAVCSQRTRRPLDVTTVAEVLTNSCLSPTCNN